MAGVPPKKGEAFYWETELYSQADTNIFQPNPTIVEGDVLVYKDGVLDGNIDILPTPIGGSSTVACQLSATEMNADRIKVVFEDAADEEWCSQSYEFFTVTTPLDELVAAIAQRQIPDSYSADGAQPTIEQAILEINQFLQERAVSGTTVTVKKPDGTTTAMTFTLDDATDPTSITRTG